MKMSRRTLADGLNARQSLLLSALQNEKPDHWRSIINELNEINAVLVKLGDTRISKIEIELA